MQIRKKINTAIRILKEKGPMGVWRTIRQKIAALSCTDENEIIFEVLQSSVQKGVMCDVGAHHGYSLLPFAKAGWQVFAFEPDPQNRARLLENVKPFPLVQVDSRAVSDEVVEDASFFTSTESSGVSSLSAFLPSHEAAYTVSITTLKDFISAQGLTRLDFLKIDTEGFDLMVLKGLPWGQVEPTIILCEFEDAKTSKLGYTYTTLADFLIERGYQVIVSEWRPIVRYGEQHAWRGYYTYPHHLHDEKGWGNLIATNDGALYQKLKLRCKPKQG